MSLQVPGTQSRMKEQNGTCVARRSIVAYNTNATPLYVGRRKTAASLGIKLNKISSDASRTGMNLEAHIEMCGTKLTVSKNRCLMKDSGH